MAEKVKLQSFKDSRGCLTVIERNVPFKIKRVYYIYNVENAIRGEHRHHKTIQAAVCISGSCVISCQSASNESFKHFELSDPNEMLIIKPEDYHTMSDFSEDAVLLVLASEYYDSKDYIHEKY